MKFLLITLGLVATIAGCIRENLSVAPTPSGSSCDAGVVSIHQFAAFCGLWAGTWNVGRRSQIRITDVAETGGAAVVITFAASDNGATPASEIFVWGKITDSTLRFNVDDSDYTFTLIKQNELDAKYSSIKNKYTARFEKILE